MAQYTTGTVSVTNGSNIVTGTDTTWVTDGITTAYSFIISVAAGGDGVLYDIASVDSETQITLTTNYGGTSISDASYGVQRDFTTPDNIPEISNGDVGTAGVFTRAMRTIQTLITSASSALTTHIADTTTHGTTGDIVGTSDTQTLSNKTITAAANTLDATVEDIAGLTPTDGNFIVGDGANFVTESGATALTSIGGQPIDATLTSISSLGTAANKYMYTTGIDTWAEGDITSFGRSILDDADEAAFKATVNLEIGTDVQAYDATLAAYAGTLTAANKIPYATALDTAGELDFLDEDDMASDSATAVPSQQSVKAYVDNTAVSLSADNTFTGTNTFDNPIVGTFPLLHIQDQKASGTGGGASSAGYNTRDLNTVLTNEISGASLSSNQITLPTGTYYMEASATCYKGDQHQLRVYDTTGAAYLTEVDGTSEIAGNSIGVSTRTFAFGRFTLSTESVIEIRHLIRTALAGNGLGTDTSPAGTIDHNTYTDVKIWQVA